MNIDSNIAQDGRSRCQMLFYIDCIKLYVHVKSYL